MNNITSYTSLKNRTKNNLKILKNTVRVRNMAKKLAQKMSTQNTNILYNTSGRIFNTRKAERNAELAELQRMRKADLQRINTMANAKILPEPVPVNIDKLSRFRGKRPSLSNPVQRHTRKYRH